jgi:membrane protein required for colicin V production
MEPTPPGLALNFLDIIVVILIGVGMYRGFKKGMVSRVAAIIGIVLSIVAGLNFSTVTQEWLSQRLVLDPTILTILSFVLIAVVVMVVVTFIFKFLEDLFAKMNLGINNALGAVAGGYLTALGISIVLSILRPLNIPSQTSISDSMTYDPLRTFAIENLRLGLGIMPLAKDALMRLDNFVKDEGQEAQQAPEPTQTAPKPTPIR